MLDPTAAAVIVAGKLSSLFNSPQHSDITIEAGPISISAHLAILSLYTPFFTSALSPSSAFAESTDRIIRFPEHPAHAIYRLVKYCYCGSYPRNSIPELEATDPDEMGPMKHYFVYMLADYVGAEELMVLATDNLRDNLQRTAENPDVGSHFTRLEEIGALISAVYGNTNAGKDDAIRNVVMDAVLRHIVGGEDPGVLRDAMQHHGEFAAELLILYNKRVRTMALDAKAEFDAKTRKMESDAKEFDARASRTAWDTKEELEVMKMKYTNAASELAKIQDQVRDIKGQVTDRCNGFIASQVPQISHLRWVERKLKDIDSA